MKLPALWTSTTILMTSRPAWSGENLSVSVWSPHCVGRYESFSYLSDELEFSWIKNESTVNMNISLAQFDVQTSLVARLS